MSRMTTLVDWDWQAGKPEEGWPETLHPDLQFFLDYWRALHGADGGLPKRQDMMPFDIKPLLPGLIIFDVFRQVDGFYRYRYRLVGSDHDRANKRSLTGLFLDDVHTQRESDRICPIYRRIVETGEPHYWKRANALPGREVTSYQRVLAPFADGDGAVGSLIGAWVWDFT